MSIRHLYILVLALIAVTSVSAQSLPVGLRALEDYYRREQLMGRVDSTLSFSIRPLNASALGRTDLFDPEQTKATDYAEQTFANGEGQFRLMPVSWDNRITNSIPYGWNDGPMLPTPGYQTLLSAGFQAKYKFISVQFRPEFVYAANKSYTGFNGETIPSWQVWYDWTNEIDMPEHFGNGSYNHFFWGQSSVRLNFRPISAGISTENLWWGPGRRNSLLMSNTAPGFLHATLNTSEPIATGIGSFEGQIVAGRLLGSGYPPTTLGRNEEYDNFYDPKRGDARYFAGAIFTYQPKWVPGLFLGISRSFTRYHNDENSGLKNYLPFLGYPDPVEANDITRRADFSSAFFRWAFPKGKSEIYFEYGRSDRPYNMRDRIVQPDNSRAYVMGFTKLVDLKKERGDLLEFNLELTQLERTRTSQIRFSPSWYTHPYVRHGYTHEGQILGAGIGPGSNVQSLEASWVRGIKRLGIQFERLVHNNDFYYIASRDIRRNWVTLGAALQGVWDYKNFIFHGELRAMSSKNYQYEIRDAVPRGNEFWNFTRYDRNNVQMNLGVLYRF